MRPFWLGASGLLLALAGCATSGAGAGGADGEPQAEHRAEHRAEPPERAVVDPFQRDFNQALRLLDTHQPVQAAEAFEACAATHATHPSVPLALFNGALARERAGQLDQAAALRQRLLARFPGSREAETAQPMLAALRSRQGRKEEAIALYRDFVERYPASPGRCSAAFNLGATLDEVRRPLEAALAYLAFGTDPRCARGDASAAARVLYRAGELHERGGRMAEARTAYQACAELAGVTEPVARRLQDEARNRARR